MAKIIEDERTADFGVGPRSLFFLASRSGYEEQPPQKQRKASARAFLFASKRSFQNQKLQKT
jgi:hypothetical protein